MEPEQPKEKPATVSGKIKIGWFSFSCCEDNTIVMTEVMNDHWQEWKQIFDFRHVKVLKSNNIFDNFDIAFIEGAVASPEQEARVKEIRSVSKKVVAIGSCACIGLPAGQRNAFTAEQKEHINFLLTRFKAGDVVKKLADVIKVDVEIPGCPMSPEMFLEKVNQLVLEFTNH